MCDFLSAASTLNLMNVSVLNGIKSQRIYERLTYGHRGTKKSWNLLLGRPPDHTCAHKGIKTMTNMRQLLRTKLRKHSG